MKELGIEGKSPRKKESEKAPVHRAKSAPTKKTKTPNMKEREGENKLNLGKRSFKDKAGKTTEVPVSILDT